MNLASWLILAASACAPERPVRAGGTLPRPGTATTETGAADTADSPAGEPEDSVGDSPVACIDAIPLACDTAPLDCEVLDTAPTCGAAPVRYEAPPLASGCVTVRIDEYEDSVWTDSSDETFDAEGRIVATRVTYGTLWCLDHLYSYDPDGNLSADAEDGDCDGAIDRTTQYLYDGLGNVTTQTTVDGEGVVESLATWSYTYDSRGNPVVADADLDGDGTVDETTTYTWSDTDQVLVAIITIGGEVDDEKVYTYDDRGFNDSIWHGFVSAHTAEWHVTGTLYWHDDAGRQTARIYTDGDFTNFGNLYTTTYDPRGNPLVEYSGLWCDAPDRWYAWAYLYEPDCSGEARIFVRDDTIPGSAWFFDGDGYIRSMESDQDDDGVPHTVYELTYTFTDPCDPEW